MADKVFTENGRRLADIYDVDGSRVGLERLYGADVQLTHDMGKEIASERYRLEYLQYLDQTVAQNEQVSGSIIVPHDLFNIQNIMVWASDGDYAKMQQITVNLLDYNSVYVPLWMWNSTSGVAAQSSVGKVHATGSVAAHDLYIPYWERLPHQAIGARDANLASTYAARSIILEGLSTGFGAGTFAFGCIVVTEHTSETNVAPRKIKSRGLPPVW